MNKLSVRKVKVSTPPKETEKKQLSKGRKLDVFAKEVVRNIQKLPK